MRAAPSPPAGHDPVGQLRALSRPGLSLRTRLPTRPPGAGPHLAQRPIQHEKSVLFSHVCLQQTTEFDLKL